MCLCHVYFMLCSIFFRCFIFYLSFIFSFILHPSCIIIFIHILFFFPSSSWFICLFVTKRGRVYRRVYWCVSSFLYDSCAHSQREKFYLVHIRRGRKPLGKCIYQGGEDIFLWENIVLFVLLYAYFLVALWCFKLHSISMLCCFHCIVFLC